MAKRIVVATDSFKGSLTAAETCRIIAETIKAERSDMEIKTIPIADGGEGTAEAMLSAMKGKWIPCRATGPLPQMRVDAGFAWFEKEKISLVEMASANGLPLLKVHQRNPLKTTTIGTGELIKASLAKKPAKIFLAVGGSATVDGGTGAASVFGWRFLDEADRPLEPCGGSLADIRKIIPPKKPLRLPGIEVLCDVENPLCGPKGAAGVFAPQKGATPKMVRQLEKGLENLAVLVRRQLGKNIDVPKAGAAGGLAAGAMAFFDAKLVSGINRLMDYTNLSAELKKADWVITGEGCFDSQSLDGKVVSGITKAAKKTDTRVAVICGSMKVKQQVYKKFGIDCAIPLKKAGQSLDYTIRNSRGLLKNAAQKFVEQYL
jgi:glycerate kinase